MGFTLKEEILCPLRPGGDAPCATAAPGSAVAPPSGNHDQLHEKLRNDPVSFIANDTQYHRHVDSHVVVNDAAAKPNKRLPQAFHRSLWLIDIDIHSLSLFQRKLFRIKTMEEAMPGFSLAGKSAATHYRNAGMTSLANSFIAFITSSCAIPPNLNVALKISKS